MTVRKIEFDDILAWVERRAARLRMHDGRTPGEAVFMFDAEDIEHFAALARLLALIDLHKGEVRKVLGRGRRAR